MYERKKCNLTDMKIVLLLAGICCFLWGSATPAIKTGYRLFRIDSGDTFSILLFAGTRFLLAGFLVILFHSLKKGRWMMPPEGAGLPIIKLSLAQTVLQYYFFYVGLSHATGVHGAIITGTNVFISILFASLIFRYEMLTKRKLAGCFLGFAGIVIMNLSGAGSDTLFELSFAGEGFVLLAQVFYAISSALVKKYSQEYDVVTMSGYQFMCGGAILMGIGLFGDGSIRGGQSAPAYLLLLYLALISAVAYTIWGVLLKYNPVSRVTVFGFMNPVFGVFLSAVFLGESSQALSWNTLAALVLVCMGIYVVNGTVHGN
ncbi:MAG: DMT family transporter [Lachnospiraceae bacterium]|nr:DMT family transporter [Lachnospiraceae bacterium]